MSFAQAMKPQGDFVSYIKKECAGLIFKSTLELRN